MLEYRAFLDARSLIADFSDRRIQNPARDFPRTDSLRFD